MTRLSAIRSYILYNAWTRVLVPLLVLTLYLAVYSWLLNSFLAGESASVSSVFIERAWKLSAGLVAASSLMFLVLYRFSQGRNLVYRCDVDRPRIGDCWLILLPLTPVVQYILNNQDILSPTDSLFILVVFAVFSFLFIIAIPAALAAIASARTLMFLGLAFTFTMTNMASLSAQRLWFEEGSLGMQLAVFGGVFLTGLLSYVRVGRRFTYALLVLFFLANGANQFFQEGQEQPASIRADTNSMLIKWVGSKKPTITPNIYLLVYDAYVPNETMLGYGIDNSPQEEYLENLGFTLYPHTYSVAGFTLGTMSRVLDVSRDFFGNARSAVSGRGVVQNLLQSFGYETYGIFWSDFFFQTDGSGYDVSYPLAKGPSLMLIKAIVMGEFRFDVEVDTSPRDEFVEYKNRIFARPSDRPRFVYMHDNLPNHSQNSGRCRKHETKLFAKRLERANLEMKHNLDAIRKFDPAGLIIVAGDHGPYLTKNCSDTGGVYKRSAISRLDIQDRYGTFLAIRWPDGRPPRLGDITVLQDVFVVVFAYLFDDPRLRDIRVKSSTMRPAIISGASVHEGRILGGIHHRRPLFLGRN